MIGQNENSTAMLATTFGMMLLTAETQPSLDERTARELSVLARVLERRLTEVRARLAARPAEVVNMAVAVGY